MPEERVKIISDFDIPKTCKQLQREWINMYHKFVPQFAKILNPLRES